MILNSGLDAACTTSAGSGVSAFNGFVTFAAFGTGSSEPSAVDTALDAQVGAHSSSSGGFAGSYDAGLDATNNLMWHEATFTRVFNIDSNVNATEWGLAASPSGNLSVRDLFRADPNDPMSSPIALTLEDGDQLQLVVTLRVQAAWEYENKSFVITGAPGNDANGTHDGQATMSSGSQTSASSVTDVLAAVWPGASARGKVWWGDNSSRTKSQYLTGSSATGSGSQVPYTPGAFYRDATVVFGTSVGNADITAFEVHGGNYAGMGYRFLLTNPPYLTKQNTHRLTLTYRKHISRL